MDEITVCREIQKKKRMKKNEMKKYKMKKY